jgi:ComF family protein
MESVPWLVDSGCGRCGSRLDSGGHCRLCQAIHPALEFIRSTCWFTGCAPELVHQLKYAGRKDIAPLLAELTVAAGIANALPALPDLVVAVPLHWKRRIRRGFNQSELIAKELAGMTGLELAGPTVVRVRPTATQTRLSPEQRRENVAGAFDCRGESVDRRTVLVVDDVMTTGATLGEVARSLVAAGARRVFGWSFARA